MPGIMAQLPAITDEGRALATRAATLRLAVTGDLANLRLRMEEVSRWINPPWDSLNDRPDPRPDETQTATRDGRPKIHTDLVSQVVDRWAALQAGVPFIFRCRPRYLQPPIEDPNDAQAADMKRRLYELDREGEQRRTERIEATTADWIENANLTRTWLWANWAKEAFGKSIIKTSWDPDLEQPTAELYENPAVVAYGWSKRYGTRRLAWVDVFDEVDPIEVERRFGYRMPIDSFGNVDLNAWTATGDQSTDMDQRVEQQNAVQAKVVIEEYWEWVPGVGATDTKPAKGAFARYAFIIAGRVIETQEYSFLRQLPFHVLETVHIPTYMHGKSTAESVISINAAYDDLLTRQHEVIEFESGPRYLGIGMKNADEVDIPAPFELLPLDLDQMIQQLDTRVDFFPSELHAKQLTEEALTRATGLTEIAWGKSPNAQTSGRAMSAEWRAVELPLSGRLINQGPVAKELISCWWDWAEAYSADAREIGNHNRRFEILWVPFDIRDKTEKTLDLIQRMQAHLIDPETAIQESGYENSAEIMAKIRRYLLDPAWNPLNVQQWLTLQMLSIQIQQAQLQLAQQRAAAQQQGAQAPGPTTPGTGPTPTEVLGQGNAAAAQGAQGPSGPVTTANNQPGTVPGGVQSKTGVLLRTPLQGGIGNQTQVALGGGTGQQPSAGQQPA